MIMHAFNASTREAESLREIWSTEQLPGQPGLHRNPVSKEPKRNAAHEEWKQHNKRAQQLIQVLATAFFRDRLWL